MSDANAFMTVLIAGLIGFASARVLSLARLESPPAGLMRTNYRGVPVPAVLGGPIAIGGLVGLGSLSILVAMGNGDARVETLGLAMSIVLVVMWAAGAWDDRRGDERPRGFSGHLGALRSGRLTGGAVKLLGGGVAGWLAGDILASGWTILEIALLVALSANLINLFDRAPGRAGKVSLVLAVPLMFATPVPWAVAAAGTFGAVLACLPLDLSERAMLGDAGANPVGAVLGLGLASLPQPGRVIALVVVFALNLASEVWSFSRGIERVPWLAAIDRWGRRERGEHPDPK